MGGKARYDEDGRKICPKCGLAHDDDRYQLHKGRPSGWCRSCRSEKEAERRRAAGVKKKHLSEIRDGEKLCMECGEFKSVSEFSPSERGLGGVSAYCRPCQADKFRDPERTRKATARYRKCKGPEYLAQHRLNMFKRRKNIEVASDGTVTREFLTKLYAQEICTYCKQETPEKKRTADHVVPIIKKGKHSVSNLVMACHSCNSKKRDLDVEVFLEKLKNEK